MNLNSNYLSVVTIHIDFCFTELYFSLLVWTQIEWLTENYWLMLIGLIRLFDSVKISNEKCLITRNIILKSNCKYSNYSITFKILLMSDPSQKRTIAVFFCQIFIFPSYFLPLCKWLLDTCDIENSNVRRVDTILCKELKGCL